MQHEQNQDFMDELYDQRRHAVAMDEEEPEFEEEEEEGQLEFVNDEEGGPFGPLERQPRVIFDWDGEIHFEEEAQVQARAEQDAERARWKNENVRRARDPNSRWESINHNDMWTDDPQYNHLQWQFPTNKMKELEKRFVVVRTDHYEHVENARLLNRQPLPVQMKNTLQAIYYEAEGCRCCDRHTTDRPTFCGELQMLPYHNTEVHLDQKENRCICTCRHSMRRVSEYIYEN